MNSTLAYPLTRYGLIQIKGQDALTFLQGQLSCDATLAKDEKSILGARCNLQGRVTALFRLFQFEESYYLRLPRNLITTLIENLRKFAIFSKVTLSDVSEQFSVFGLKTEHPISVAGAYLTQTTRPYRYEIYLRKSEAELFSEYKIADEEEWFFENLSEGLVDIYPETSEIFTPHDLNLPDFNAVSFTKGCYMGQEIVARMQYRATLKQHLYRTTIEIDNETSLIRNTGIYQEETRVGSLVDYAYTNTGSYQLILLLRDETTQNLLMNDFILPTVFPCKKN